MAVHDAVSPQSSSQRRLVTGSASISRTSQDGSQQVQELHDVQLRYKLAAPTFKTLCEVPSTPDRREVLQRACTATEFRTLPMKPTERSFFREINDNTPIPYPVHGHISEPWQKAFLLVQIDLQKGGWSKRISAESRKNLHQERGRIYVILDRTIRCLADILGHRKDGRGVAVALDVLRSVHAGVWEGSNNELLQVDGIGLVKKERLVQAGIKSIKRLSELDFFHIERLLSRNPPFGHEMLQQLAGFPRLNAQVETLGSFRDLAATDQAGSLPSPASDDTLDGFMVVRIVLTYENGDFPFWRKKHPWTTLVLESDGGKLLWFWRGSVKRLEGGKDLVIGLNIKKGEQFKLSFACEEIVGTILRSNHTV
ncbi:hypothetical protein HIM_05987 [Hirsutella minnesotensis 3608]|uniref:SEC63 domain-containing protein n=1 Tax=Hirsutella minnesotensis 3608 TaxID=1043627 RepID=A0A0F7ZZQ6_9HYPO|nr:hypothetical protein HIM_05987 [Hirsutella minnesotensis 3608]